MVCILCCMFIICYAAHGKHVVALFAHEGFPEYEYSLSLAENISSINGKVKRAEDSLSAEL